MNEPDLEQQMADNKPLPPVSVWVNAGFGNRSYLCRINEDSMMTLPEALVKEMGMQVGDELEWNFDEAEGVIYLRVKEKQWEIPDWLKEE